MTMKEPTLRDQKEFVALKAQQTTLKTDVSALYDFVLKETAKWEALNKVRTINIDENENLEKVTDPRANVNV